MTPPTQLTVECIGCHARRIIKPGEVLANDVPTCPTCLLPMIPIEAVRDRG